MNQTISSESDQAQKAFDSRIGRSVVPGVQYRVPDSDRISLNMQAAWQRGFGFLKGRSFSASSILLKSSEIVVLGYLRIRVLLLLYEMQTGGN